jgi:hypothetical protein
MTSQDQEDEALEAQLRAYRPAGPPEHLRQAVLGLPAGRRSGRVPEWLTFVALLLLALTLRWSARSDAVFSSGHSAASAIPSPRANDGLYDSRAFALHQVVEEWRGLESVGMPVDPSILRGER